jgi:tetratricopeptide (TPR) repeat protein
MAGRRKLFERAMRKGHNYAWDGRWEEAIREYRKALSEFPNDTTALTSLGFAFLESGKLEEALDAYQRADRLAPGDPLILKRVAEVQERLGREDLAADSYASLADVHLQKGALEEALKSFLKAKELFPDHLEAHKGLAEVYEKQGKTAQAIKEHLNLARILQRKEEAIERCLTALKLDPYNIGALALLGALRCGEQAEVAEPLISLEEGWTPREEARRKALEDLAEEMLEVGREEEIKALDFQDRGMVDEAIRYFRRAVEAGMEGPSVYFNLGLLYQEKLCFEEAIEYLSSAVDFPDYAIGAHFSLGECNLAQGRIEESLKHFVEVLKIVDLKSAPPERADLLSKLYDGLAEGFSTKRAFAFISSLVNFLSDEGWEERIKEARGCIEAITEGGFAISLADLVTTPRSEEALSAIALSQDYLKLDKALMAIEECYSAIEISPDFLPIHLQLAEVLMQQGRVEEAVGKYKKVADVYQVRGDLGQAIEICDYALRIAPMEIALREKLIELLIRKGEIEKALEHYLAAADSYFQLAQVEKALKKCEEALQLSPEKEWEVRILHRIGDIHTQRADWRGAISAYERIKNASPKDEKARLCLVELYHKLGKRERAIREIEELLAIYREEGKEEKILAVLEEMAEEKGLKEV